MPTRAAAAREAAFVASSAGSTNQLSSPPTIPQADKTRRGKGINASNKIATKKSKKDNTINIENVDLEEGLDALSGPSESTEAGLPTPVTNLNKRKRALPKKKGDGVVNGEFVKGGWDELPHNMGKVDSASGVDRQDEATIEGIVAPPSKKSRRSFAKAFEEEENVTVKIEESTESAPATGIAKKVLKPCTSRGKDNTSQHVTPESSENVYEDPILEEIKEDYPGEFKEEVKDSKSSSKGRGKAIAIKEDEDVEVKDEKPKRKRLSKAKKVDKSEVVQAVVGDLIDATKTTTKKARKPKKNPYGLTPGETPYPDFPMPTVEACRQVNRLLSALHGEVIAPKEIPAPSLQVTGCGEVPAVLDALIRTRLSAATTNKNAGYAFEGLVKRYGIATEGIGMGSISWSKVRDSNEEDIAEAIKRGGLAKVKAKSIKTILDMVHEQNIIRRDAFVKEKKSGIKADVLGSEHQTQGQKDLEIAVADQGILSLCYMRNLNSEEAMTELTKFPGIGVKTASCVILFCFQRPSFAVDTHVWRLCKWLKWVPDGATRDQTFSHCEVRIPDELKYSLHQLFIRHGKTCGRCRAITGESSEVWAEANCPIEKLVERTGKRKGGVIDGGQIKKAAATGGKKGSKKGKKTDEWDSEMEKDESEEPEEPILDDDEDEEDFVEDEEDD